MSHMKEITISPLQNPKQILLYLNYAIYKSHYYTKRYLYTVTNGQSNENMCSIRLYFKSHSQYKGKIQCLRHFLHVITN